MMSTKFFVFGLFGFLLSLFFCQVHADTSAIYEIALSWQKVPGAKRYQIQVGLDPNFINVVGEDQVQSPQWVFQYNPERMGVQNQIFFRIASMNDRGAVGKFSPPQAVALPVLPPSEKGSRSFSLEWGGSLSAGYGGFKQKTLEADLKSVSSDSLLLQQKILMQLDLVQSIQMNSPKRFASLFLQFRYATLKAIPSVIPSDQPNLSVIEIQSDLVKWLSTSSRFHFGFGLNLSRSVRWIKSGPAAVDAQGGVSLGPNLFFLWGASNLTGLSPKEFGSYFSFPMTGMFSGAQSGVNSGVWSEWSLLKNAKVSLGPRIEANFSYLRWAVPQDTSVMNWSVWGALACHFGL
jgi:hypothetical protein